MAATSEQRSTVVGAFEDRQQADTAISELRQAGFREDQIAIQEDRSVGGPESDRTTVTVTAEGRYDEATALLRRHGAYDLRTTAHASRTAEAAERIQLHEEELQAHKQPVETGAARVRKEVVTEQRTLEVPVQREEVVIERQAPTGEPGASDLRPGDEFLVRSTSGREYRGRANAVDPERVTATLLAGGEPVGIRVEHLDLRSLFVLIPLNLLA
ncbi:MAG: DUF2382 domain-containing protein, partial [Planctomycetaceae bacterium]|nr:DUF2382 domain-containing protein [Planctomycetaceae bacterium]